MRGGNSINPIEFVGKNEKGGFDFQYDINYDTVKTVDLINNEITAEITNYNNTLDKNEKNRGNNLIKGENTEIVLVDKSVVDKSVIDSFTPFIMVSEFTIDGKKVPECPNSLGNVLQLNNLPAGIALNLCAEDDGINTNIFTFNTDIESDKDVTLDGRNEVETLEFNGNNTNLEGSVKLLGSELNKIVINTSDSMVKLDASAIEKDKLTIKVKDNIGEKVEIKEITSGDKKIDIDVGASNTVEFTNPNPDGEQVVYKINKLLSNNSSTVSATGKVKLIM